MAEYFAGQHARAERKADSHVLGHLPQGDPNVGQGLPQGDLSYHFLYHLLCF